jgi:glyoxylase-like metal-dependent hydrolase (beta-lactamase superfamily II)
MITIPRRIILPAAMVLALVSLPSFGQPVNPIVREGVTEKISEHVHVIPDGSVALVPNVGIIVGSRATLVVDTGLGARNGAAVMREVGKVSSHAELYLGTTHVHPEHDLGAMAFPPATKLLRSTDQQKDIAEFGLQLAKTFSGRSPFVAELLKDAEFRKADIVFEREHVIDLGGVRVRVIAMGANHTRGDTVFLVEPDGVLFAGDVAMRPQPSFASPYSTVRRWLASLDLLEKLAPNKIVPSHGPMGDVGLITGYRSYLTTVQTRARELKQAGQSVDATVQAVTTELAGKYPDRGRLGGAVRAAYNEVGKD